jgi:amidase
MGHHVEAMQLPVKEGFAKDFSIYWGMLSFLISAFGKRAIDPSFDASKLDKLSKGLASYYKKHFCCTLPVLYRLNRTARQVSKMFDHYDIVLSPVLAHTTPKLGYLTPDQDFDQLFDRLLRYVSFTPLNNAAGSPAMSLPMGTSMAGLPIGVHLSAAHGDERTLLEIAFALEEAKPWKKIQDIVASTFAPAVAPTRVATKKGAG